MTPVCLPAAAGFASCDAIRLNNPADWQGRHVTSTKKPGSSSTTLSGYGPTDLQSAYGLTSASGLSGGGKTVAIVDAYDDPNVASDLAQYRFTESLPPLCGTPYSDLYAAAATVPTCVGDFTRAYASGSQPSNNTGWAEEISLDVDMVSAICPNCNILLVEAASNSFSDLGAAVDYAAAHGAYAISNSYGGGESSTETTQLDPYYDHVGVAITASSGDGGYGVEYPAASQYVTAVGGTHLTSSTTSSGGTTWSETVWSGAGSGCSAYEPIPSWQPVTSLCSHRTVADVAADADPNTGVAVYDTDGEPGWMVFGGTSVASPIIASVYALAGNGTTPLALYTSSASLNRISSGMNSGNPHHPCPNYLCNAADSLQSWNLASGGSSSGWYNGPTGTGTPQGTGSF
ncbi:MAG: S53 family peptidase [Acidimicrobiales bacterium]